MAAYDSLKSLVQQAIRTNGNNEITGQVLQNVLMAMIDELGGENGYAGVATPSTNPGAPDGKVFYFATEAGTYTHFDGATLAKGIHLLVFNGVTWSHQTLYTIDSEVTSGSNNLITSGAVYTKIINAINALDATVSKSAGADGLSLSLTETDGKVTNISGSIAPQTYDAYGAASAAQIAASTDATNKVSAAKTQILGDAASDYNTLGKLEDKIQAEASRAAAAESALNTAKANKATTLAGYGINDAYTKTEVNGLVSTPHQNYVTVPTYASLPATGSADTIYRVSNYNGSTSQVDASVYSEYAWNGSGYTFLRVDSQIGEVFDITVYNSNTKYADLAAALGTNGANVPSSIRRGGMSVKFVQSSDNKYVQYRLMADAWSTVVTDWQGIDDEPTPGSDNLVKSGGVAKYLPFYDIENLSPTIANNNAYINSNGNVVNGGDAFYTTPITLPSRCTIVVVCKGYLGNISIISKVVTENVTYNRLIVSIDNQVRQYSYMNTSDNDIQIALSGLNLGGLDAYIVKNKAVTDIVPLIKQNKVDIKQNKVDIEQHEVDISILNLLENKYNYTIYSDNNYVSVWGTVGGGGNGKMTTGIILSPGKTITAVCKGYSTNVAILSKVVQEGETYSVLERSIDSTVRAYSYTNNSDYDVNICVSWIGAIDELSVFIEDFNKPDANNGRFSKNFVSIKSNSIYGKGIIKVEAYATAEFIAEIGANMFELITGYNSDDHCFYIQLKKQGTNTLVVNIKENVGTAPTRIFEWHYRDPLNRYDIHIIVDCDIITSIQNTGLLLQFADMSFIEQSENGAIQNIQNTKSIENALEISEFKNILSPTIANNNAYINPQGQVVNGGSAFYTEPITLPSKYTILVKAKSYLTNVAIISEVVTAGSQYNPLVIGIGTTVREYLYTNNTNSDLQIALSGLNDGGLSAFTIIQINKLTEAIPAIAFDKTIQYPLVNPVNETMDMLGIVKDWGFIGDSLNSGEIYYNRADSTRISGDMYAWSWGQSICQLCRTIGTNFSVGGLTAKSWIQRYWNTSTTGYKTGGSEETFNANPKQVYTICLGTNEINAMINGSMDAEARAAYIGNWNDVDITDFTNNADTFYGNYAGIIQRIKSIQPSAKIFLINIFAMFHSNSIRLEINAAIADIQSHFNNTFLVDMETLVPVTQEIENKYRVWGHLTVQGYMWLSYVIGNIINRIMRNNLPAFNSLPFIGTNQDNGTL